MKTPILAIFALFTIVLLLLLVACEPEDAARIESHYTAEEFSILQRTLDIPNREIDYITNHPAHIQNQGFHNTVIESNKALLGRVLFYDKKLSKNEQVSCASCHRQALAFADNKAFSTGFNGHLTARNSLALGATPGFEDSYNGDGGGTNNKNADVIQRANFFWDERAFSIAQQSGMSLTDPVEMGMPNLREVAQRVKEQPHYKVLSQKAYGGDYITEQAILEALQEFVNALSSTKSRFDTGLNGTLDPQKDFSNFSVLENTGKQIYMQNCASCHSSRMIGLTKSIANNGLDAYYTDKGLENVTKIREHEGVFKVPMLRNVALSAPYMHDGRFATLHDVVEHYNSGIKAHPNLDLNLRNEQRRAEPKRLHLNAYQKQALVAFLHTLTDETFIKDKRFADPFKQK